MDKNAVLSNNRHRNGHVKAQSSIIKPNKTNCVGE
jgi:hypothetical protein